MQTEFKCRASASGLLMTNAQVKQPIDVYNDAVLEISRLAEIQYKSKNTETKTYIDRQSKINSYKEKLPTLKANKDKTILSDTTKSYLKEWLKEQIYGVRNEISSKYLTKGVEMENESIEVYGIYKDLDFIVKNSKRFNNEYLTGEPDLILENKIVDIKTSWDCFSFPLFANDVPDKKYYWQLQSYMALTGYESAELAYVLVNTPEHLQYNVLDMTDYTNLDLKYRVKTFKIERNEDDINALYQRVQDCREYIKELTNAD